jgi:hypothetical protein
VTPGRHAVSGGGLSAGGAGGIHGTRAEEGRGGKDDWDFGEVIELSEWFLKTRVI